MNTPDDFSGPVNLGNPGEFTILELAKTIIAMTGSSSEIVFSRCRPMIRCSDNRIFPLPAGC